MTWVNAGCGTHRAPEPWVNTDVWENEDTHPDVLVTSEDPFPFPKGSIERVMLGHVLEHIPLDDMPWFLCCLESALEPGGEILVVCPDVFRTLNLWKQGTEPWFMVESVIEHAAYPGTTEWPGALHQWNANERRIVEMLEVAGFEQVTALASPPEGWPVVGWADWQCCVSAVRT